MSYPSEYENAINNLKELRKSIERTFISGRIKALLEASKSTLQKYLQLLNQKTVTGSLTGNINRYMMIINGNPLYTPEGLIMQAKLKYTGEIKGYPQVKTGEPNVDIRDLPSVDVFIETFSPDITLLEKGHEAMWGQMFVLQTDKGQFKTTPDAKNAFFNYYNFVPLGREKFQASLSDGIGDFGTYNTIKGECTTLAVSVQKTDTDEIIDYSLFVFLDCDLITSDNVHKHFPFAVVNPSCNADKPSATFVVAGKRIKSDDTGLFVGDVREGQLMGFTKTHNTVGTPTTETLYSEPKTLTIEVDGAEYGYTDPPAGVYTKYASEPISITATPYDSSVFKGWQIDGIGVPPDKNPLQFTMIRDRYVRAIFRPELFQTLFPNEDIETTYCTAYVNYKVVEPKYQAIDEGVPDGDASYIMIGTSGDFDVIVKFGLTNPTIPEGSTIEKVEHVAVIYPRFAYTPTIKLGIETYGAIYTSDWLRVPAGGYYEIKYAWDKNPYTQETWTLDELKDLVLVLIGRKYTGWINVTLAHIDVWYT